MMPGHKRQSLYSMAMLYISSILIVQLWHALIATGFMKDSGRKERGEKSYASYREENYAGHHFQKVVTCF